MTDDINDSLDEMGECRPIMPGELIRSAVITDPEVELGSGANVMLESTGDGLHAMTIMTDGACVMLPDLSREDLEQLSGIICDVL